MAKDDTYLATQTRSSLGLGSASHEQLGKLAPPGQGLSAGTCEGGGGERTSTRATQGWCLDVRHGDAAAIEAQHNEADAGR